MASTSPKDVNRTLVSAVLRAERMTAVPQVGEGADRTRARTRSFLNVDRALPKVRLRPDASWSARLARQAGRWKWPDIADLGRSSPSTC